MGEGYRDRRRDERSAMPVMVRLRIYQKVMILHIHHYRAIRESGSE